ncbi:response regulator transcription factor [Lactiplantibacillus plantarum]|uniref:response regulator transcription factor n=1 Tax=Lactiplantibacillus plantarum TaxID=1590 RepID=UPI00189FF441|nr:response regulator transcription factor [Lactiplantibacillus plantarum]MCV3761861.1 response regulator transcription factor [Companilactobacillus farciminis]MDB7777742.1 response regulator transcription factor [Lactiplantibacillus plantarum]MDB7786719.1 response regulator transcription factor [Lactiplantibacillus plantarum]MDB7789646.1 response regulator transcription factor [Lactiplantibacillus plantarum]
MPKILLVDDEASVIDFLQQDLAFEDYAVLTATDGQAAFTTYQQNQDDLDLIILDWMLPKMDGLEVLRRIRKHDTIPVIMMTARDYVSDKVAGLDGGADDYITKPFDTEELLARVRVILRHADQQQNLQAVYKFADLELNTKSRQVKRNHHLVQLTQREYELLLTLMKNAPITFTRDELLDQVWGVDFEGQPNIVDVYIRYLRHKIDTDTQRKLIHTVRGVGYCLRDDTHA